jgi:arginine-tRNA-protein transferase
MTEIPQQSARDPTPVVLGPSHPCPYLPGRVARFAYATHLPPGDAGFASLLDAGFRRSGLFVYRTACEGCAQCRSLRIPTWRFQPDRSHRRTLSRNEDLDVVVGPAKFDAERAALYARYLDTRHDGQMSSNAAELEEGLYKSPIETLELSARLEGRLVAVGIIDVQPDALSLVYSAWDPDHHKRSLGTAFVLWSIALAQKLDFSHVHLGYYIEGSRRMAYKARFLPHEILMPEVRGVSWSDGGSRSGRLKPPRPTALDGRVAFQDPAPASAGYRRPKGGVPRHRQPQPSGINSRAASEGTGSGTAPSSRPDTSRSVQ